MAIIARRLKTSRTGKRPAGVFCASALLLQFLAASVDAAGGSPVQDRMSQDIAGGRPLVAHVVVALCDNKHQGIQPVPESLGNGQDPRWNLYWGALLGVRTYLPKHGGWRIVSRAKTPGKSVLDRIVFYRNVRRGGVEVDTYLVADAWDGSQIKAAIDRFLSFAAGREAETVRIGEADVATTLTAGGGAHLVAYVGHNGLMDFEAGRIPEEAEGARPRSSIVLACRSKQYFRDHLARGGSHALLLTNGLMAPEAYTLDAAVRAWFGGKTPGEVREAAGAAYHKYQKCGQRAATRLFEVEE